MSQRTTKRQVVWDHMLQLAQEGLGQREIVSAQRDKFMLDTEHGAATALSRNLEADGFIRADRDTLLFRGASEQLHERLEALKPGIANESDKGYEARWSEIDEFDIERMFNVVRSIVAGHGGRA